MFYIQIDKSACMGFFFSYKTREKTRKSVIPTKTLKSSFQFIFPIQSLKTIWLTALLSVPCICDEIALLYITFTTHYVF